jgi:predicted glycogen debranching enzyme
MQLSKKAEYRHNPDWYYDVEYQKELDRGYEGLEDLYVPGYFEMEIKKGESIYFSGGDTFIDPTLLAEKFDEENYSRTSRTSFYNCLKNAAQQFYYRPTENDAYLIAGYPWFKVRARDLFVSLPGCTLSIDDPVRFEKIMTTATPAIRNFMKDGVVDKVIKEIEMPDVFLWAIWAMQQYSKMQGIAQCAERYGELIQEIIDYIIGNRHPNLRLDANGLLYSDGKNKAITWMNSTIDDGKPIVPRSGYIVEFNALWYNALKFASELAGMQENKEKTAQLEAIASKSGTSFVETFVNGYGYLFDFIDGTYADWSVRPNMLFAIALDYSPLNRQQKRAVLNIITKELLTPKGVRSLSPQSEGYHPYYTGAQRDRDLAYHQGTAWPWLLGFYLEAYLRLYQLSGFSFAERMLIGIDEEMNMHCIGTLSELFDGNPPFQNGGAISFAMNVAAILRILKLLESFAEIASE